MSKIFEIILFVVFFISLDLLSAAAPIVGESSPFAPWAAKLEYNKDGVAFGTLTKEVLAVNFFPHSAEVMPDLIDEIWESPELTSLAVLRKIDEEFIAVTLKANRQNESDEAPIIFEATKVMTTEKISEILRLVYVTTTLIDDEESSAIFSLLIKSHEVKKRLREIIVSLHKLSALDVERFEKRFKDCKGFTEKVVNATGISKSGDTIYISTESDEIGRYRFKYSIGKLKILGTYKDKSALCPSFVQMIAVRKAAERRNQFQIDSIKRTTIINAVTRECLAFDLGLISDVKDKSPVYCINNFRESMFLLSPNGRNSLEIMMALDPSLQTLEDVINRIENIYVQFEGSSPTVTITLKKSINVGW